jgi:DNA-binding transcriptional LysR family regulator
MADKSPRVPNFDKLDLNLLRVFDLIMREGNLTRAGKRLGRKPPAMSQLLGRLRRELGDPLFESSGRNMIPTRRANEIAPCIRAALEEVRIGLTRPRSFDPRSAQRTFAIDIPAGGDYVIAPLLIEHAQKYAPGVSFRISNDRASILRQELRSGETDLAVDYEEVEDGDIRHKLLYNDPFVVIARRGHPEIARQGGLTPELFNRIGHVAVGWTRTRGESPVDVRLAKFGIKRQPKAYVPTIGAIPGIVARTDLVAMLSIRVARHMEKHWAIESHTAPFEITPVPLHLVWHMRFDSDPAHMWLRTALEDVVERI